MPTHIIKKYHKKRNKEKLFKTQFTNKQIVTNKKDDIKRSGYQIVSQGIISSSTELTKVLL